MSVFASNDPTPGCTATRVRSTAGRIEFEVPIHEVDQMGVVWLGHYLKRLEYARTRLFQNLDLGGELSHKFSYVLVVIESRLRHTVPLRFEDRVRVEARLVDLDYRIHIAHQVSNLTTDERAAKGHTMLVTLDRDPGGAMLIQIPGVSSPSSPKQSTLHEQ